MSKVWSTGHWSKQISHYLDYHQSLKPEWRECYISYDALLKYILTSINNEDSCTRFRDAFLTEFSQVSKLYFQNLQVFEKRLRTLLGSFEELNSAKPFSGIVKGKEDFRSDFIELYQEVEFLESFVQINCHAGEDLLNGFETMTILNHGIDREKVFGHEPWDHMESLHRLLKRIEKDFGELYLSNEPENALFVLRRKESRHNQKDVFKLAIFSGACVPLLFLIFYIAFFEAPATPAIPRFWSVFPVFRCSFLFIFYYFLYGLNTYFWKRFRINHVYLLEFNPRSHIMDHVRSFKCGSYLFFIWCICFFYYLGVSKGMFTFFGVESKFFPMICCIACVCLIVAPFHIMHLSARTTLLETVMNLFLTPFAHCRFRENFAADIGTSTVIPLQDLAYIFCFYFSGTWVSNQKSNDCFRINKVLGSIIAVTPYWWRFLQCMYHGIKTRHYPHFINAGKYSSAILQIALNAIQANYGGGFDALKYIWLVAVFVSTIYCFIWDLTMDWGLFDIDMKKKRIFREERKFHWLYYTLSVAYNLIGRFAWAGTLSYNFIGNGKDFLKIAFGCAELIRRANWSILRLEWMQASNQMKFRRNKYVPALHS